MAIVNILKGLIGKEDLAFGSGSFDRLKSDGSLQTLTKIGFSSFLTNAVTPQDYGAAGDGVTDDVEALQAMFDDTEVNQFVLIPPGTYMSSRGPLIMRYPNTYVWCLGTIKLLPGAILPAEDGSIGGNPLHPATAIIHFRDVHTCLWEGGVLDGNNNIGPNGFAISHNTTFRPYTAGNIGYRNILSNVYIKDCIHDTDNDPGGDTKHSFGIGQGGAKGVTVQGGVPQTICNNVRVTDCTIGFSYEAGVSGETAAPDLIVSNLSVKDCMIGAYFRGIGGATGTGALGGKEFTSVWNNVIFRNCGTGNEPPVDRDIDAANFGVIDAVRGYNIRMTNLKIINDTGAPTPFRGTFRNCFFQGEIDTPQMKNLHNGQHNLNGVGPNDAESPSRHNAFYLRVKLHGTGAAGDEITHAWLTDAGPGYKIAYSHYDLEVLVGNGVNDYVSHFDNLDAPLYDSSGELLDVSVSWKVRDLGGSGSASGFGTKLDGGGLAVDGGSDFALPSTAIGYFAHNNLTWQNDQNVGIVRLRSADGVSEVAMGISSGGTACIATPTGLYVNHDGWDGRHLRLGDYHLWVDATGDLRIKSSLPTSDTDGTIVGTQS